MRARTIFITFVSVFLSGCVAAVLVGTAAGLAVYDRRSVSMLAKDARIFHVVHKALVSDPRFKDSHILITSFNQTVLLVGQTPFAAKRLLIEKMVRSISSVRRLYNEITVDYPISMTQRANDTLLTSEIRSLMLAKKGLESGSIRIVTENKVVYLMGIVTHEQANLAVNIARQVNGVEKVVKVFQYIV